MPLVNDSISVLNSEMHRDSLIFDLSVGIAIYAFWLALVLYGDTLPLVALFILGGYVSCLHGSFQHIAVHGYPTKHEWLNSLLVYPPLSLYFPYPIYRATHLDHHACEVLTDVETDPESVYLSSGHFHGLNRLSRLVYRFNFTLAGRLLIGPFVSLYHLWKNEFRLIIAGDTQRMRTWLVHILWSAAILIFVQLAGLPIWKYLLCFVYPGISLILFRSYTEHRWSTSTDERSLIVEGSMITRILYLNNNYHWVHHENPGLPWKMIPRVFYQRREEILKRNGNFYYKGYTDILKRLWQDKLIDPVHPREVN